jgi:hypothetical protein
MSELHLVKRWAETQPDGSIAFLVRISEELPVLGGKTTTIIEDIVPANAQTKRVKADGIDCDALLAA